MIAWILLGTVAVLIILVAFLTPFLYLKFLRKVPPSKAVVRCGGSHAAVNPETGAVEYAQCRVVSGGNLLVFPWHSTVELDLNTIPIEVGAPGTLCKNGVTVNIRANAEVHIPNDPKNIRLAAECLGGKSQDAINDEVVQLLLASIRTIVAGMKPIDLLDDRFKFQQHGQQIAGELLTELGLKVKSFTILQISDDHGFYKQINDARTAENAAEQQKKADLAILDAKLSEENRIKGQVEAEQERKRQVIEQEALTRQGEVAWKKQVDLDMIKSAEEVDSATRQKDERIKQAEAIAKIEREAKQKKSQLDVIQAEYANKQAEERAQQELVKEQKERERIAVERDQSVALEHERLAIEQQKVGLAEAERNRARAKADQQQRLAEVDADHLIALERRKIADVAAETLQAEGRGEAAKRVELQEAENLLERHRLVNTAEGEAEKIRQISEADRERLIKLSEARKIEAEAEAAGNQAKAIAEAKREEALGLAAAKREEAIGLATAEARKATGLAEAEAQRKLVEAYEELDPAAQRYFLMQKAPEILQSMLGEQGLASIFAELAKGMQAMDIKVLDLNGGRSGSDPTANPISRYGTEVLNLFIQSVATMQSSGLGDLLTKVGIDPKLWATKPAGKDSSDWEQLATGERVPGRPDADAPEKQSSPGI